METMGITNKSENKSERRKVEQLDEKLTGLVEHANSLSMRLDAALNRTRSPQPSDVEKKEDPHIPDCSFERIDTRISHLRVALESIDNHISELDGLI